MIYMRNITRPTNYINTMINRCHFIQLNTLEHVELLQNMNAQLYRLLLNSLLTNNEWKPIILHHFFSINSILYISKYKNLTQIVNVILCSNKRHVHESHLNFFIYSVHNLERYNIYILKICFYCRKQYAYHERYFNYKYLIRHSFVLNLTNKLLNQIITQ